jgi:hypothetical protein
LNRIFLNLLITIDSFVTVAVFQRSTHLARRISIIIITKRSRHGRSRPDRPADSAVVVVGVDSEAASEEDRPTVEDSAVVAGSAARREADSGTSSQQLSGSVT